MIRLAVISASFVLVAWGFSINESANAQQPPAAQEDGAAAPAAGENQAAPLPPNVYPYPRGAHPPVFVTEVYRLGRHQNSRNLNVFVYGMKPDVWQILNCYQPCCCSSSGICCDCRNQGRYAYEGYPCRNQYGYGSQAIPTPVDPSLDDAAPPPPLPPIGVDPGPAAPDPFQNDSP
jgi:hypothetical protein